VISRKFLGLLAEPLGAVFLDIAHVAIRHTGRQIWGPGTLILRSLCMKTRYRFEINVQQVLQSIRNRKLAALRHRLTARVERPRPQHQTLEAIVLPSAKPDLRPNQRFVLLSFPVFLVTESVRPIASANLRAAR
jgi:hypothetical protein